jgi:hypothetical protein
MIHIQLLHLLVVLKVVNVTKRLTHSKLECLSLSDILSKSNIC